MNNYSCFTGENTKELKYEICQVTYYVLVDHSAVHSKPSNET